MFQFEAVSICHVETLERTAYTLYAINQNRLNQSIKIKEANSDFKNICFIMIVEKLKENNWKYYRLKKLYFNIYLFFFIHYNKVTLRCCVKFRGKVV